MDRRIAREGGLRLLCGGFSRWRRFAKIERVAAREVPASFMSPSSPSLPPVVGLDIGTTKICAIVAGEGEGGALSILGIDARPSSGVRRGVVVDVPDTVAAIKDALSRAAHMAGVDIEGVVAGITGDHILSQNLEGSVTVASPGGEVGAFDVERALAATMLETARDVEVIHCLPRSFALDGQTGLRKPIGLVGSRLEVQAHVVTGQSSFLRNTFACLSGAGVRADALVLEPLATAEAVSTRTERELGVLVLDIGGGTSDLAAFVDGSAIYSAALPVGGNHVTRDISIGLSTPFEFAETLKVGSGAATRDMIPHGEALEVMTAGGASRLRIPRALLGEIIEARMRELFELSLAMAMQSGLAGRVPGGLILSGGGALLPGAMDLASRIFGLPVRLGVPEGVAGWSAQVASPQFATAVGLCRIALAQQTNEAGRGAALPYARRVWSLVPPNTIMARSAAPEPAPVPSPSPQTEPEARVETAPDSTTLVPATLAQAPRASEEFPAQMQFAPKPAPAPPSEIESAPESPVAATETPAPPKEQAAPRANRPRMSVVGEAKVSALANIPSASAIAAPPSEREASPSAPREEENSPVPVLALKDDNALQSERAAPDSDAPETATEREAPVRQVPLRPQPSSDIAPKTPLRLPAPSANYARTLLRGIVARANILFDPSPSNEGMGEIARDRLLRRDSAPDSANSDAASPDSPKVESEMGAASNAPALHWWLRFKTFIGFGEG